MYLFFWRTKRLPWPTFWNSLHYSILLLLLLKYNFFCFLWHTILIEFNRISVLWCNIPLVAKMKTVMIYSPSNCFKPVWVSLFCRTQNNVFWRMLVTKYLTVAHDLHCFFYILWKSMATVNSMISHILHNLLSCSTEERNSHRFGPTWQTQF